MPPTAPPPPRARRSAFAAAFLSLLYPGLGHAYLGRWLRALAWAILPAIAIVAGAGVVVTSYSEAAAGGDGSPIGALAEVFAPLLDPAMGPAIYSVIFIDLVYRLAAVVDAYRLARDPSVGSTGSRMLSTVGLLGIVLVLIATHVAVARPVSYAHEGVGGIQSGDDTPLPDLTALGLELPDVSPAPEPSAAGGAQPGTADPTAEPTPQPTASAGPGWDGKQRLNILLIGADGGRQGIAEKSYLTDTMIVVSVDPRTGRVAFISLPRDMSGIPLPRSWPAARAYPNGRFNDKINTLYTYARGAPGLFPGNDRERGYEALMGALSELYGLKIDYYVAVDLNSFRGVINDVLKGVIVDVQVPVYDPQYPSADGRGNLKLYVPPGLQYMNGQRALAYSRSRHGSSDFDRAARQQRLFSSVRDQLDLSSLFAPGVIDKLVKQVTRHVRTNIPPKMIPRLVSLAQEVDLDRRENLVLSSSAYGRICYPCPPNGYWMLIANPANIRRAVQGVFSGSLKSERERQRVEDEDAVVHVLNGAGGSNAKATNIADALAARGLSAVVPPIAGGRADDDDYRDTVITIYNGAGAELTETIKRLKQTLRKARVVEADDPDQVADIVVIVGSRTKAIRGRR